MFVSSLPQGAAEALQTGLIGPSVPAPAGSEAGFAAWLQTGLQLSAGLPASGLPPQPALAAGASTALQTFAEMTSGQPSGSGASPILSGTPVNTGLMAASAHGLQPFATGRMPDQFGQPPDQPPNQPAGQMPEQISGQKADRISGQSGRSLTQSVIAAAAMEASKAEPVPARKSGAVAFVLTDRPAAAGRVNSESVLQTASQSAAPPQMPELTWRPQTLTGPLPPTASSGGPGNPVPSVTSADIAVQMARFKAEGRNQFTIRLTPESLGTVTIRLNVTDAAGLTAQMQVEKPETLALLQKDMAGLEKALKAQGFSTSDGDLTVALKASATLARGGDAAMNSAPDQRFGQGQAQAQNQSQNQSQNQVQNGTQAPTSTQGQNAASSAQAPNTHQAANPLLPASGAPDRAGSGMPLSSGDMGFQQSHQDRGARGQDGFEHGARGQFGHPDADAADTAPPDMAAVIANAYHGDHLLIGMSGRVDVSI